jgi:hypothetical protein
MSIYIYLPPKYVIGNFAILPILAWDVPKQNYSLGHPDSELRLFLFGK